MNGRTGHSDSERFDRAATRTEEVGRSDARFGRALSWSYVMTGGRTVVTMVVSLILARLLGPEAFGTIAMANVFIILIEMFVRQGLGAAIVQRPGLTTRHLDTAFWMTVVAITAVAPIAVVGSGWWADVNGLPGLQAVIVGLTPSLILKGLGVVQEGKIRREMDFRALALRTNAAVLIGGAVGISLAFTGAGVWALVAQQVVMAAIELVVLWRMSDWRPRWRFERSCARDLVGFSGHSALAALGVFISRRSDALLIGLFFGPVAVGLYRMAVRFTELCLQVTSGALQSVILPELSKFSADRDAFNDRTVEIVRLGGLLAIPLLGVLAAASDPLMLVLGPEWAPASAALQILCLLAAVQAVSHFIGPVLQAAGRPGILAALTWVTAVVNSVSFVAAGLVAGGYQVESQVLFLAAVQTAMFVLTLVMGALPVVRRALGLGVLRILRAVWPATLAATTGYVGTMALRALSDGTWTPGPFVAAVLAGIVATVLSAGVLLALDPTARRLFSLVLRKLRPEGGFGPNAIEGA